MSNKIMFLSFLLIMLYMPFIFVHAETSISVNDEASLKNAIKNESINEIILNNDIETNEKITITRPLSIDGKGHTIKYVGKFGDSDDAKVWAGIYVLQFYKTTGKLKDIKLTGANAALLVNGSEMTFEGTIDVSGNGFGGIELSQGKGVTNDSKLTVSENAHIVNTTDNDNAPTLWVPSDSKDATVIMNGMARTINSGTELELEELEEIFLEKPPKTGDNFAQYLVMESMAMLSIVSGLIILRKTKEEI